MEFAKPLPILVMVGESVFSAGPSIAALSNVALLVGKIPMFFFGSGKGVAALARTIAVKAFAETLQTQRWRGILIDGDILIEPTDVPILADDIKEAENRHLNIVAPIRTLNGLANIYHKDGKQLTNEEFAALKHMQRIQLGGLAFYYGDVIADYVFHEGDNSRGEDVNYFLDNKLPLNVMKNVNMKHLKVVPL
jgi:hypothetical protein